MIIWRGKITSSFTSAKIAQELMVNSMRIVNTGAVECKINLKVTNGEKSTSVNYETVDILPHDLMLQPGDYFKDENFGMMANWVVIITVDQGEISYYFTITPQ